MGLLSGLLGNASQADVAEVEANLQNVLAEGESVERAFQIVRDLMIFTRTRLIMVDIQGLTGKKREYHSIPYRAISHFSVETAGHFDLESELKIWISGTAEPIQRTFKAGDAIISVQKALATYVK
ncbi:MAG TPA: PH domain-containing protein [Thermoanaerobaculia bacterium]|nr:PH domain-containing protein [Thermoanaerobaculia bacterium]